MKKLLLALLFLPFLSQSQDLSCGNNICVVEFNAGWNEENSITWLNGLTNCGIVRISLDANKVTQSQQKDYDITSVPTIIIFREGVELARFNADISLKSVATKEDIQKIIDELIE